MMRRDRLFLVVTIAAIFSADLYFFLLPKLQSMRQGSEHVCSCGSNNFTLPRLGGLASPQLYNWTSSQPMEGITSEPADRGSKLERLFAHPLYNIQTPVLAPEERLVESEQLMEYYRRKVSRWERSVSALFSLDFRFFFFTCCFMLFTLPSPFLMTGSQLNMTCALTQLVVKEVGLNVSVKAR